VSDGDPGDFFPVGSLYRGFGVVDYYSTTNCRIDLPYIYINFYINL
jgi:hypothetical protein